MAAKIEMVKRVIDGDTFTTSVRKQPIRLANVFAPEANTKLGKKAAKHLSELIGGKEVELNILAIDIYGRVVAGVKIDGKSINAAMNRHLGRT